MHLRLVLTQFHSLQVETPVIDRAQEEAERRGRVRIQKRQSIGHAHGLAHAAVVNAAAAAAGTPASVQPDGTPLQPGEPLLTFYSRDFFSTLDRRPGILKVPTFYLEFLVALKF